MQWVFLCYYIDMDNLKIIAHIHTDFPEKFGIPRQSGLVPEATGYIEFEPEFRRTDAVKGIEEFDYLWLLWKFEGIPTDTFNATVRPPRLGGNETRGVFATRSPFRPNPIGLSSVKLEEVIIEVSNAPILKVSGIDLRDNTPIFDIKPYLPYADAHTDASNGFAGAHLNENLSVIIKESELNKFDLNKQKALINILKGDPRPHYQSDVSREYGLCYAGFNVKFKVKENILTVTEIKKSGEA